MILRRVAAALAAIAMIAGGFVARAAIHDDAPSSANAGVLVCATQFVALCRSVAPEELTVVGQDAAATIDELAMTDAEPALWLTFESFPQMLNEARQRAGLEPFVVTASELASSPIAVVARPDEGDALRDACGADDGVDLACVADRSSRLAVSPIDTGIGLLSVSAIFDAYLGDVVDLQDPTLLPWARALRRGSDGWELTAGTAVATQQIRPAIAVAVGVEAELVPARRDDFDVLYASPMTRARVVLMQPSGFDVPDDLMSDLAEGLLADGWQGGAARDAGALPPASTILAIRQYWKDLA